MISPVSNYQGLPEIIYGTAFKFEKTAPLVEAALKAGFRAIDTAGAKGAYREALVGEGIAAAIAGGVCTREELYIQTKFSPYKTGKDPLLYPYDTTSPIASQVIESVTSSLVNLGTEYIDCLVLHSIYPSMAETLVAYRAMESLTPDKVRSLGLSNIDLISLRHIYETATVKPVTVQNRFTRDTTPNPIFTPGLPHPLVPWDRDVRAYCHEMGIAYAPWGMLWGSLDNLDGKGRILEEFGKRVGVSREIACFAALRALGGWVSPLCGTKDEGRMRDTLMGLEMIKRWVGESEGNMEVWEAFMAEFKGVVDLDEGRKSDPVRGRTGILRANGDDRRQGSDRASR
ncbi:aldo/keto reductase [Leptodontidium sp. MPI-SDFR-AT-0119]|nr:aldo/keto reductase [Leptodontidium sp. MPI-SDFR-AT-0119]